MLYLEQVLHWLSQAEVKKLMGWPANDVLGLRREEAVAVAFDQVKLQLVRGSFASLGLDLKTTIRDFVPL